MWKTCSEVGTIDVDASELRKVHFLTAGTVNLEARGFKTVAQPNGEHFLLVAEGARAETIDTREILLIDLGQAAG